MFSFIQMFASTPQQDRGARTAGRILHGAAGYDFLLWLVTGGRERRFRQTLLDLARVTPGEAVLDVGCGTGTLAILARQRVGPGGTVCAIDASPAMISRARRKAARASVDVAFEIAAAEQLPFSDCRFDVALSTVMLHHLPRHARQQSAREMRRVLKPGGRVLVVDFGTPSRERRSLIGRFHRHGHTQLRDIVDLLGAAALNPIESGAVGINNLHFALAVRPADTHDR